MHWSAVHSALPKKTYKRGALACSLVLDILISWFITLDLNSSFQGTSSGGLLAGSSQGEELLSRPPRGYLQDIV